MRTNRILVVTMIVAVATMAAGLRAQKRDDSAQLKRPTVLYPTVSPAVAAHLKRQGYPAPTSDPRKVNSKDFESADVVISLGCDLPGLEVPRGKLVRWDEVPPLSEDFARADEAIRKRVTELAEALVRSVPKER